jgi:hypothetical protein
MQGAVGNHSSFLKKIVATNQRISDMRCIKNPLKNKRRSPFDFDRFAISAQGRLSTGSGAQGLAQDDMRLLAAQNDSSVVMQTSDSSP